MSTWKQLLVKENGEPLVPLGPFSDFPQIGSSAIYYGERVDSPYPLGNEGTLITPFVRKSVADRLAQVAESLPDDHILWVWDAYRSEATQRALFDYFTEKSRPHKPDLDDAAFVAFAETFVSIPSTDPAKPSPHLTGGSVDLTIARLPRSVRGERKRILRKLEKLEGGRPLIEENPDPRVWKPAYRAHMALMDINRRFALPIDMGTNFDEMSEVAHADYFAVPRPGVRNASRIASSRRLLRDAMEKAGFAQYDPEWWHFNYGNQMWAETVGEPHAVHGPATMSTENELFETIRRGHDARQRAWHRGEVVRSTESGKGLADPAVANALAFSGGLALRYSPPSHAVQPAAVSLVAGF